MNSNGKTWRILAIALVVVFAAVGAVYSYGRLNGRFEAVEAKIEKAEDTRERVIRMETDIGHIKETVDDIKEQLKDARRQP